jgi:hypothetical protein
VLRFDGASGVPSREEEGGGGGGTRRRRRDEDDETPFLQIVKLAACPSSHGLRLAWR